MENINTEVSTVNTNIEQPTENNNQSQVVENNVQATDNNVVNDNSQVENKNTDDSFFNGEKVAKAFSQRLNKEKEKLQAQLTEELSSKYSPYEKVLDLAAKEFGMSREDYIKSILNDYDGQAPTEDIKAKDNAPKTEKDALLDQLLEERKQKDIAEQWNNQTQELLKINESLKPEDISDEMLIESNEKGIPLQYLYAYNLLTSGRENFEKAIRDKAIADIQKVNKTTGSLTSPQTNIGAVKISDMKTSDFEALKQKVLRGEITSL